MEKFTLWGLMANDEIEFLKVNKFKDKLLRISQSEEQKEKRKKEKQQQLRKLEDPRDSVTQNRLCTQGDPR